MERIYYDSRTGNVERFIQKVKTQTGWDFQKIQEDLPVDEPGHLVTFTTRFGEIPETTRRFLEQAAPFLTSVSSSGNRNWGRNFALAADIIASDYGIPILLKFELSGTSEDVQQFIQYIEEKKYGNKRFSQELDSAQ